MFASVVILVIAAAALYVKLQPAPPPLALPTAAATTPVGPLDGTWDVVAGSVAGFRVQENFLGLSNDVVGRTNAVSGVIAIADNQVTSAAFRIDLATIRVGGKTRSQFAASLETSVHPSATFTLTRPMVLSSAPTPDAIIIARATGWLSMHGASHAVTFTISGRRDGAELQAAGSIPVAFSDWGIRGPAGFGFIVSLANHGVAEFFVVLRRR
jgi:polyisoprenoid-binding protein YceI